MVKSREYVERKMKERIGTAGRWLADAMREAPDPLEVLMKDIETYAKKLADGVAEAIRRGVYQSAIKRAEAEDAWKKAIERAGAHFEERRDDIVEKSLRTYEERAKCIEEAKKKVETMPTVTRDQRIAKSQAYLKAVAECFDRVFGRKTA